MDKRKDVEELDDQLVIRVNKKLKEKLKLRAKKDRRELSDWLRIGFENIIEGKAWNN